MDYDDEREPGECSRTPSPESMIANVESGKAPGGQTYSGKYPKCPKNESMIELIDLEAEEHSSDDDDIEVISGEESETGQLRDDLFVLDTAGAEIVDVNQEDEETTISISGAPSSAQNSQNTEYSGRNSKSAGNDNVFDMKKILTNEPTSSATQEKKESTFKMACFNCGGEHSVQQCEIPLDQRRIAANRAAHYNSRRAKQERYVTAADAGQSGMQGIRPGEISDAMREALGIGPDEIPEWIYRMRQKGFIYGYPPGYLTEALDEIGKNDVLQFHTDDKTLEAPCTSRERNEEKRVPIISADTIIAYPGFNYYDRNLKDRESDHFRVPRFDEYVQLLQECTEEMFAQQQWEQAVDDNKKQKTQKENEQEIDRKRNRLDSDDSVVLLDDDVEQGKSRTSPQQSEEDVVENDTERSITPSVSQSTVSFSFETPDSHAQSTSSSGVLFGTPVVCRKEHDKKKPSLDSFRVGIVPFRAVEECSGNRGFFRELMKKVRKET